MHIFKRVMMHLGLLSDAHAMERELKFMIKLQVKGEIKSCYKPSSLIGNKSKYSDCDHHFMVIIMIQGCKIQHIH